MINSLVHGEALFEILIEGGNPYADGPLSEGECARLQQAGIDPQALDLLAIGRVVMGGRGVWACQGDQVVVLGQRYATSVDRFERHAVQHAELEKGRYGHTLRMDTADQRWAMYAVGAERAQRWVHALAPQTQAA